MNRTSAEILALEALSWTVEAGELAGFLNSSGLEIDDLRQRAGDQELLAAMLDYLLSKDALTKAFCDAKDIAPDDLHRARHLLPGGLSAS